MIPRLEAVAHGAWRPATLHIVPAHAWTEIAPGVRVLVDAGHDIGMSVQTFTAVDGCAPDCVHVQPCPRPAAHMPAEYDGTWPPDPCAAGCPDPARHAEGGHDV